MVAGPATERQAGFISAGAPCRHVGETRDSGGDSPALSPMVASPSGGQTLAGSGTMCGRFTQSMSWKRLHGLYQMPRQATALNLRPRYNGCPTQDFAAVRLDGSEQSIVKLRWGLIPSWSKDARIGARLINARSERD